MVFACFTRFVLKAILMPGSIFLMLVGLFVGTFGVALANLWSGISDSGFWFTLQDDFLDIVIAFGCWTFLLSLFCCVAIGCDLKKCIIVYCVTSVVFLIVQIGIASAIGTNDISENRVKNGLTEMLKDFHEGGRNAKSNFIEYIFRNLQCCGVDDFREDFKYIDFKNVYLREQAKVSVTSVIPYTCCKKYNWMNHLIDINDLKDCMEHPTKKNAYMEGCSGIVLETAQKTSTFAIVLVALTTLCEAFLVVCAVFFYFEEL